MPQVGHYGPGDLLWYLEHNSTILAEVSDVAWGIDPKIEAGGAGLGLMKNRYFKTTGPASGTWKIDRALLQRTDGGMLFLDLLAGAKVMQQEPIAAAASSYTVILNTALVSIVEVRLNTSLQVLREGLDYTVNYIAGVITFPVATPEAATVRYLASSRRLQQFLINGGFEDALTNIWTPIGTATIARNTANAYVEGNALGVTPVAANDGVQYGISMTLEPGRSYRLRLKAKAAAAETLVGKWNDGASDQTMTPASVTLTTAFAAYEFTFTATKATIPNIKILDSKASPGLFYIDEVQLIEDTTANNPTVGLNAMDNGLAAPFTFNILARRVTDGVMVYKLMQCALTGKLDYKGSSKAAYSESVSGEYLDLITE
jgi:hypothetical protein